MSPSKMKALIADHVNQKLSLVEREEIPSVDEQDDVIVRIVCAGVCGTDISILHGKQPGTHGIVNGHEGLGQVVSVGKAASTNGQSLEIGDRVVIQPNQSCGRCESCVKYKNVNCNFCLEHFTYGIHVDGTMAEYAKFKAKYLRRIPKEFTSRNAVLIEPFAAVYHGFKKIQATALPKHEILIMGAGMAALLWIRLLSYKGFDKITCYCRTESKAKLTTTLGSRETISGSINGLKIDKKFDLIVDCTGEPKCINWACDHLAQNGTVVIYGVCPEESRSFFDPYKLWTLEGKIIASFIYDDGKEFDEAIETAWEMEKLGLLSLEDFNVGVYSFSDYEQGWIEFVNKTIFKLVIASDEQESL